MKAWTGPAAAAALMGTVVGANYLTTTAGFITVGPGLTATAGTDARLTGATGAQFEAAISMLARGAEARVFSRSPNLA